LLGSKEKKLSKYWLLVFCIFILVPIILWGQEKNHFSFQTDSIQRQQTVMAHQTIMNRGPYLDMATQGGINIHWRTNGNTPSVVRYGTSMANLSELKADSTPVKNHVITLSGLAPNQKYYYSVGTFQQSYQGDANNFFYTAPSVNATEKIRFWVTGDFGLAGPEQTAVAQSFLQFNANEKINGWLWLGDNAYNSGTDAEYQSHIFSVFPHLLKNIPLFPALGNHDYGNHPYQSPQALGHNFPYFSIFQLPEFSGTEKYYSWNYANVHFIALDSYGAFNYPGSPMYQWLLQDLADNQAPWTVVYFHHPPYSKGTHDSDVEQELIDMRNNIVPLLEAYHVDLVLSGHSHIYERSYFMKGHTGTESNFNPALYPQGNIVQVGYGPFVKTSINPQGTLYVVNGSGSKKSGWTESGYPHNAMIRSIENKTGSLLLTIEKDTLRGIFVQSDGIIGDTFAIHRQSIIAPMEKSKQNNVLIFPNPSNHGFQIVIENDFAEESFCSLVVKDLRGNKIYRQDKNLSAKNCFRHFIGKNELENKKGLYLIEIYQNGQLLKSEKVILE